MSELRDRMRRGAVVALAAMAAATVASGAEAQTWRTLTSSRQLWDTEPTAIEVEYGAGNLRVERLDSQSLLYRMELRYDEERMTPVAEFDSAARLLRLGARGRDHSGGRSREGSTAEIALSDRVPLDLGLHFGAGEANMDLGGLRIRKLNVETGASETSISFDSPNPIRAESVSLRAGAAELTVRGLGNLRAERISFEGGVGETTLDFGGSWSGSASAVVKMGIGAVTLRIPRSLGVQINRSSFLTSFEADGLQRRDGSYFSDNWDRAANRLTVDIEAALGTIEVYWIDG